MWTPCAHGVLNRSRVSLCDFDFGALESCISYCRRRLESGTVISCTIGQWTRMKIRCPPSRQIRLWRQGTDLCAAHGSYCSRKVPPSSSCPTEEPGVAWKHASWGWLLQPQHRWQSSGPRHRRWRRLEVPSAASPAHASSAARWGRGLPRTSRHGASCEPTGDWHRCHLRCYSERSVTEQKAVCSVGRGCARESKYVAGSCGRRCR